MQRRFSAFLAVLGLFLSSAAIAQDEQGPVRLSPRGEQGGETVSLGALEDSTRIHLVEGWRYRAADDPGFARPEFDDAAWTLTDPALRRGALPEDWDWHGIGWFRLRFTVDAGLAGKPLLLRLRQAGASELYLDGQLLGTYGSIGPPTVPATPLEGIVFTLEETREHVLAVRFASPRPETYHRVGLYGGFRMSLGLVAEVLPADVEQIRWASANMWLFTGIFLAFALLHALLFAFHPEIRENLYFALLCTSAAVLSYFLFVREVLRDPRLILLAEPAMNTAGLLLGTFALRFVYGIFYDRLPRIYTILWGIVLVIGVWSWIDASSSMPFVFIVMLLCFVEMMRVVALALHRRRQGAGILGVGVLVLAAGFSLGLLAKLGIIPDNWTVGTIIPFSSVLVLLFTMSLYLSQQFAETAQELRRKLRQVEELSEQKLEQERRAQREELERKLLEADYARKVEELEEARELQLSMLPKRLPQIAELEIAAFMSTATEVGGDYYDFHLGGDGVLTVAIGDATGHGMRAGTMVTATKSLFNVLGEDTDLLKTLARSTSALKRMNLRKLAMALTLAQYREGQLRLAAAGMPPAYIYRAASGEVESVLLAGMPLGSLPSFPYRESAVELGSADVVLLMSDGFPERLNPEEEMLGYDKAVECFMEAAASGSAQQIIDHLVKAGEAWSEGRAADDDTTFVVLKQA